MKKKILTPLLALSLILTSVTPSYAAEIKEISDGDLSGAEIEVSALIGSTFTVGIPTSVVINPATRTGNFSISIKGDLDPNYKLVVAPTDEITSREGTNIFLYDVDKLYREYQKNAITVDVVQSKTEFFQNDINTVTPFMQPVQLSAQSEITAGQWSSVLEYNVTLEKLSRQAGIYDADGNLYQELTLANAEVNASGVKDLITQPNSEVVLPDGVTSVFGFSFYGCTNLKSVVFPESLTNIGSSAFDNCTNLESITLPESLQTIEAQAFKKCALTEVTIPHNVTSVETATFYECNSLESVTFDNCNPVLGDGVFNKCAALSTIDFGTGIKSTGQYCFAQCPSLESVTVNIETIGESSFQECTSLTSVTILSNTKTIGPMAFYKCPQLTSVTIEEGIEIIKDGVFASSPLISSITIPNSVITVWPGAFYNVNHIEYHGSLDTSTWGAQFIN